MEPVIILVVLLVIGVPLALAVWFIVRLSRDKQAIQELTGRIASLEGKLSSLERSKQETGAIPAEEFEAAAPSQPVMPAEGEGPPIIPPEPIIPPAAPAIPPLIRVPPPLPVAAVSAAKETPPANAPPKLEKLPERPSVIQGINWEQFVGAKLFAWLGGLALFLGVVFFVKLAFERNLIPPELRVAAGFATGLGLLVGGVRMSRKDLAVLGQTLCATGVLILYAVTFACRSIYHFEFFGAMPTFLLMVLITATAFLLAVRLEALVVAILGMLGGFLTPILISTGHDNPLALFGYIAILDVGLIFVARHRNWSFLTSLAAFGTAIIQMLWAAKFFTTGKYFEGSKFLIPVAVLLGFSLLFLAAAASEKRRAKLDLWLAGAVVGLVAVAIGFSAWFLSFQPLAQNPWLTFGFILAIDLVLTALVLLEPRLEPAQPLAGLAVFLLLAGWTSGSLNNSLLNAGLAYYFLFALLHSVFPVVLQRIRGTPRLVWATQLFPSLALILVLIPIMRLAEVSFIVWPFVLLVDVLAIGLAVLTASVVSVLVVLGLTLAATGALIFKIPATLTGMPTSFFLLGAFAVFFVLAGLWLARKFKPQSPADPSRLTDDLFMPGNLAAQLPMLSAVLPFLLLIMAALRLPLSNPSPIFALALLLSVLLLGLSPILSLDWLPAVAVTCVAGLECTWHLNRFDPASPYPALVWYLIFLFVFTCFPYIFGRRYVDKTVPWAAAAMAGPAQFLLVHRLVKESFPNQVMGLLPAAFAILPIIGLVAALKRKTAPDKARMNQMAWFGGVALFFITLIFPIQFDNQWITVGWSLEGAALLWLFHRVPHPGLRLAGAGLLTIAFVRLALNPAVFDYPRSAHPIFNWYLYTYGITTACLFIGARLLAPPRNIVRGVKVQPILATLGTVLAFLLLTLEIADYFSPPGAPLSLDFTAQFGRDMTYSIAWALFALVLLVVGIKRGLRAARYAGIALFGVTLLKLFFHDFANLPQLYRIGAFIAVAVALLLASFAIQRFYAAEARSRNQ